jgi:hypothetical protein
VPNQHSSMDDANLRTREVGGEVDCSVQWIVDWARVRCHAEPELGERSIPIGVANRALCMKIMRLRRSTSITTQAFNWARTFSRLSLWVVRGNAFMRMPSSHCHAYDPKKLHGR